MTIWKFGLAITGQQTIVMPADARILTAQTQNGCVFLWAIVSPDAPKVERRFLIMGTGHPMPSGQFDYIATVQMGPLVWHVFEELARA